MVRPSALFKVAFLIALTVSSLHLSGRCVDKVPPHRDTTWSLQRLLGVLRATWSANKLIDGATFTNQ